MYRIVAIKHADAKPEHIELIIKLKSAAWNYSFEKQQTWIENNIVPQDIHLILFCEELPVAYLNLVRILMTINGQEVDGWGVGNVCSSVKGKGYGRELMKFTNEFILNSHGIGLLFCKKPLVAFYSLCGWKMINKVHLDLNFDNTYIETMQYSYKNDIKQILYRDRIF